MTQTQAIINYMQEKGSISPKEAFKLGYITRLGGLIFSLRHQGYEIETIDEDNIDIFGRRCHPYARYILKGIPQKKTVTDDNDPSIEKSFGDI